MSVLHGAAAPLIATRAAWVLPIAAPPIRDGGIVSHRGRIVDVGPWGDVESRLAEREGAGVAVQRHDAGARAMLPALVNAHTHFELSWMRGRLGSFETLAEWVAALVAMRRREAADEQTASEAGIAEALACGTGAVADIGNTPASCGPLSRSPLEAVVFRELIGFDASDPQDLVDRAVEEARSVSAPNVRVALAAHAPYSVAPSLFRAIVAQARAENGPLLSVHVAESAEEEQFLVEGAGPWRELLERVGAWTPAWVAPRCSPLRYLERLGWLAEGTLLVHAVHVTPAELEVVASSGASIVTCPRSNERLRVGTPPVGDFLSSGVNLAIGTDSLASNDDLNVFQELAALRRLAPEVPASRLLACATLNGARALRLHAELGTLEVGKRASAVAVVIDRDAPDVEEQVLRGVSPNDVRWVAA